jgi:hypothetical protein
MADETLSDAIDWETYEAAAGLASGHVPVRVGTVGYGSPVGVIPGSHELADWIWTPLICDGPDRPTSLTGYARGPGAAGTLIGELLDPVTSQVIQEFVAPYERTCLALLRPTIARVEAPGKVVAVAADVTEATQG